jgi:hypothetical protein
MFQTFMRMNMSILKTLKSQIAKGKDLIDRTEVRAPMALKDLGQKFDTGIERFKKGVDYITPTVHVEEQKQIEYRRFTHLG